MREKFKELAHGSTCYNQDIADIKWLVSTLRGVLIKYIDEIPKGFDFTVDLYRESKDCFAWGVKFSFWFPDRSPPEKDIDVVLLKVSESALVRVPWKEVAWTPFGNDMPPHIAKAFAGNLDDLLTTALDALKEASATKSLAAINSLIERGDPHQLKRSVRW